MYFDSRKYKGSKFHKSTTNNTDDREGEPKVESWETAKGDADVKRSSENLRFGADGDLQRFEQGSFPSQSTSRRSVPSLPKLSAPRTSRSGFSGGSFSDDFSVPSREVLKAALQRTGSSLDGAQLDDFVDQLSRELKVVGRQKRTFARSPKSYSFDCAQGESPFSDNFRSKFATEDDFGDDFDSTFEAPKEGKYLVSEENTSETTEHKKSELRRQKTTEFSDLSNVQQKVPVESQKVPVKRRLSTTRTRRSSEETSSSSTETQKVTQTSTKKKVNSGGDLTPDSVISCDGKKVTCENITTFFLALH